MKHLLQLFFIFNILYIFFPSTVDAAINFTVSPIRYELEMQPGESRTLPASIRNNGTGTVILPTTASDFQSSGSGGVPSFVRKSELVHPDQQLSNWITIDDSSVNVDAGKEVTTNFTIDVPTTATPGGHYGAVFFKKPGSENVGDISINVDYGILVLVNVAGDVNVDAEIGDPEIENNSSTSGYFKGSTYTTIPGDNSWFIGRDDEDNPVYQNPDDCPLGDFTASQFDEKCFTSVLDTDEPPLFGNDTQEPGLFEQDFEIIFRFPIENKGNTHIKPDGKITLRDENGEIIKGIGKKTIENNRGAIIGTEIVDYIPINDQGGNILPLSGREFESYWKGFPYKTYDDAGNQIVNYWTPSEYYTKQNKQEAGFLMFWERVSEVRQSKMITADIEIIYTDEQGNPIEFSVAKEFPVQYVEEKVTVNPYIVLTTLLLATAGMMIWFASSQWIGAGKRSPCWNCKTRIKSSWQTCPHCKILQNKKEHKKALEAQKAKAIRRKPRSTKKK